MQGRQNTYCCSLTCQHLVMAVSLPGELRSNRPPPEPQPGAAAVRSSLACSMRSLMLSRCCITLFCVSSCLWRAIALACFPTQGLKEQFAYSHKTRTQRAGLAVFISDMIISCLLLLETWSCKCVKYGHALHMALAGVVSGYCQGIQSYYLLSEL